ncbi:MAG TPA: ABC transporter ATP-binding protein [Gaiellales bacterium]|nr:ABC transporter ATP-binding protein [Gaiellales bacterium]
MRASRPTALVGPSGAGKSTTLRLIAGLVKPDSGRVVCNGETWFDGQRATPVEDRRVGFVFQDYALFPHMSVRANVAYGARLPVDPLLDQVGIAHLARVRPRKLSGGERQRVALARALASDPRLLLLDEPLSALDPSTRGKVAERLSETVRSAGVPALIVTHSYEEAVSLGEEVVVLEQGKVTQSGDPHALLREPRTAFVARFAGLNYLEGNAVGRDVVLDSGERIRLAEPATGRVAVLIAPWEITIQRSRPDESSAQNHLPVRIGSLVVTGSRARVGVGALTAEVTADSARALALAEGEEVLASFKSTAVQTIPLTDEPEPSMRT